MREIAFRYAQALYDLCPNSRQQELILSELQTLENLFTREKEVGDFFASPLVKETEKVLGKAITDRGLSGDTCQFMLVLAKKGRMNFFSEIVLAFQEIDDKANGVTRGNVRSAYPLSLEEKQKIQSVISKVTQKKVVLTYKEDSNLIGGLVANVGSYTFDDTLTSHLTRLSDDLKRRTH